jgi:PIN domain nuclease of toxin-antitoxin system
MKFLLDTHIFLWFISGDPRLPAGWRDTIQRPQHEIFLSVVSLWETIIKYQLGKLPLPEPPERYLPIQRERHKIIDLPLDAPVFSSLLRFPRFIVIRLTGC